MNIRIGAADYDVQYTDDAIILNGRECIADVDYDLCKIRCNEALIDAIAYGMVDFIRDNPEIVDKIKNGERLSI